MNTKIILRRLELKDEGSLVKALHDWDGDPRFMFHQHYEMGSSYSDYLDLMSKWEKGIQLPAGFVPSTTLSAFLGETIVGRLNLRHALNDFLLHNAGHIGYGVIPKFRKQGIAKTMLLQALPLAKKLGIDRMLVTCDDDNVGSFKTIESCGGVLENKVVIKEGLPLKRRYWISIAGSST